MGAECWGPAKSVFDSPQHSALSTQHRVQEEGTVRRVTLILTGALLSLVVLPAMAQAPGGPGGGGMPPQFQKFMEQTKYRRQMRGQLRAIGEINRDPATAVSPTQA